jgi:hypothetical protein
VQIPRPWKNNFYYERKRRKNGTDQHDEDQQQTEKGLTIGWLWIILKMMSDTVR